MLVGATGSGKSTLVDGIANYIMGVSFEDPFRFTMVTLEEEEKKTHNQVHLQIRDKLQVESSPGYPSYFYHWDNHVHIPLNFSTFLFITYIYMYI